MKQETVEELKTWFIYFSGVAVGIISAMVVLLVLQ